MTTHDYLLSPTNLFFFSKENEDASGSIYNPFGDALHNSDNKERGVEMQHPDKSARADFEDVRTPTLASKKGMFHPFTASSSTRGRYPGKSSNR